MRTTQVSVVTFVVGNTTAPAALRGLETADVRFDNVVEIDGMEGFVEQAAKAL